MGTPMIEVRGLEKTFRQGAKEIRALRGVDLAVAPGRIHGIIGQSGAGKSTLVRCLTLLEPPTSGTVSVAGKDLTRESRSGLLDSRRRIGMVFQHANLFSSRTARDNVAYPLEVAGGSDATARRARADELLALVGLEGFEGSYPAQLSGGQKQRVGIARALASDPDVLLCDEPTSALDPASTEGVLTLIEDLSRRLGLTVLVITHEMHVVKRLCHEVSLLQDGRIVQSGDLGDVASDLDSPLSAALLPLPTPHAARDQRLVEVLGPGRLPAHHPAGPRRGRRRRRDPGRHRRGPRGGALLPPAPGPVRHGGLGRRRGGAPAGGRPDRSRPHGSAGSPGPRHRG